MNDTAPIPFFEPEDEELEELFKDKRAFYNEIMQLVLSQNDYFLRPTLADLRQLPENPEIEQLKAKIKMALQAPHIPPAKNPAYLLYRNGALITMARKFTSKIPKKSKTSNLTVETDNLPEIVPENKTQARGMILLRALKLNPDRCLHTPACKMLLESAEGAVMAAAVIRRSMECLTEIYDGKVIYEKSDGSYRIRINV